MLKLIEKTAKEFSETVKKDRPLRIVSHIDADGISSSAIIAKSLKRDNIQYWLSHFKQFENAFQQLKQEASQDMWNSVLILDFGLSNEKFKQIELFRKKIFIIDHHILSNKAKQIVENTNNITLINSRNFNINNTATSGLAYLFAKKLNEKNSELAHIALIGIMGDIGSISLEDINHTILQDAKKAGKIEIRRGLKIFSSTRPLHKSLEFSNFLIPNVTGNEKGALELLRQTGINIKENGRYRTLLDLSKEEMLKLVTSVIARTQTQENGRKIDESEIIDNIYLIKINGRIYDTKEIATLLNACGRLNKANIGLEVCHGNLSTAERIYTKYRRTISNALAWMNENHKTQNIIEGKNFLIINSQNNIKDVLIGVITSILASSNTFENKVLVGMSYSESNRIKVSIRVNNLNINLKLLLEKICREIGAESGGHEKAAGCLLSRQKEKIFIEKLKESLGQLQQITTNKLQQ